jgi:hypothetical protein
LNIRKRRCTTSLPYLWNCPFIRNGFTSGNNGRLGIPEYVLDKRVSPKIGAEIWRIKPDGTEELIGVFKKENNIKRFYKIK